jgi:hypothetical protein
VKVFGGAARQMLIFPKRKAMYMIFKDSRLRYGSRATRGQTILTQAAEPVGPVVLSTLSRRSVKQNLEGSP